MEEQARSTENKEMENFFAGWDSMSQEEKRKYGKRLPTMEFVDSMMRRFQEDHECMKKGEDEDFNSGLNYIKMYKTTFNEIVGIGKEIDVESGRMPEDGVSASSDEACGLM